MKQCCIGTGASTDSEDWNYVIATRGSLIRNEKADGDTVEKNDEFVSLPSERNAKGWFIS